MRVRTAETGDIPRIVEIYNHAVLHTFATADHEPVSIKSRLDWLSERQKIGFPVLVSASDDDIVTGWGSLSQYSDKTGYRFTAENSVYIAPEYQRQGLGRLLLTKLVEEGHSLGLRSIIARIDATNLGSIDLHEQLGFVEVGRYKQAVEKFGSWQDVAHLQLMLNSGVQP